MINDTLYLSTFISYEGTAQINGFPAVNIGVSESTLTPPGTSIAAFGSGWAATDFMWGSGEADTKGFVNDQMTLACPDPAPPSPPFSVPANCGCLMGTGIYSDFTQGSIWLQRSLNWDLSPLHTYVLSVRRYCRAVHH